MSIFNDKIYEQMDWLSQAVEPYICPLNDVLAVLPDTYTPSEKQILEIVNGSSWRRITPQTIIDLIIAEKQLNVGWDDRHMLAGCFKLECASISVDASAGAVDGQIKLIKHTNILDDNVIKKIIKRDIRVYINAKDVVKGAVDELGVLLFEDKNHPFFSVKTTRNKLDVISDYLENSVDQDTFKIRSTVAYKTFLHCVISYLKNQNPEDLGIIYKVLVMAKKNQVIYTIGA